MPTHAQETIRELEYAESEIRALRALIDVSVEGRAGETAVVIAIGLQALEEYDSLLRECHAGGVAGAIVLLRAVIEAAILSWRIELHPELHVEMYFAEDDRSQLTMVAGFKAWRGRRRIVGSGPLFSRATVKAMRAEIAAVRAKAIAADEPIGAKGPVVPSTQDMADRTGDSAIWEAYHVLYRTVSPWTHHSGTSLASHRFEKRPDGMHLVVGQPFDAVQVRQIAAAAVSHLIGTISRVAELGIEGHARLIQDLIAMPRPAH